MLMNEGFILETDRYIINITFKDLKFESRILHRIYSPTGCDCCKISNVGIGQVVLTPPLKKRRYAKQKYLYQNKK